MEKQTRTFFHSRFLMLKIYMVIFGALVGILFPPICIWLLGLTWDVLSLHFFALTLFSGILVGLMNYGIFTKVVAGTFVDLAHNMTEIQNQLIKDDGNTEFTASLTAIDSQDAMGEAATAFNGLVSALSNSRNQNRFLHDFALTLTRSMEREDIWDVILASIMNCSNSQGAALLLANEQRMDIISARGFDPEFMPKNGFSLEQGILVEVACSKQAISITLTEDMPFVFNALAAGVRPRKITVFPLTLRAQCGVLLVAWTDIDNNPLSEETLTAASRALAVAVDSILILQKFREMAAMDELTRIYNRRFGYQRLDEELERAQRNHSPLSISMVDIDFFKRVNDVYGHLAGDNVLKSFVAVLQENLRAHDILIRYGGEEILVVLPITDKHKAFEIMERCRVSCEENRVIWDTHKIKCTVSGGISEFGEIPSQIDNVQTLISRADSRLYKAKDKGRNRIELE